MSLRHDGNEPWKKVEELKAKRNYMWRRGETFLFGVVVVIHISSASLTIYFEKLIE